MNRLCVLIAGVLLAAGAAEAQTQPGCFHINEAGERAVGYCQAVRSGNMLYISGHTASGDMPAAVQTVYTRLGKTLAAHGLTFADVVKENVYTTDMDALVKAKDVRLPFYNNHFPAATWVSVQRLFTPQLVIEVELVAAFPPGK
jgi:enamine deaminase RidA (YjgF/YER057c/UK114 family)